MPADSPTLVVDEQDRPIGEAPRREVHRDGLWHRVVGTLLVDSQSGDVLLQKRQSGRGLDDDQWDLSASGHVDPGEEYEEAACRELREEIGVDIVPDQLEEIANFRAQSEQSGKILNRFTKGFVAHVDRASLNLTTNAAEIARLVWVPEAEFIEMVRQNRLVPGAVFAVCMWKGLPIPPEVMASYKPQLIHGMKESVA